MIAKGCLFDNPRCDMVHDLFLDLQLYGIDLDRLDTMGAELLFLCNWSNWKNSDEIRSYFVCRECTVFAYQWWHEDLLEEQAIQCYETRSVVIPKWKSRA